MILAKIVEIFGRRNDMNKQSPIINTFFAINMFFAIVLILGWAGILFVSFLLYLMSDMFRLLGNGILVYIVIFIYALTFALPIIFRKRISKHLPLPLSFIVFTVLSVMIVGFILIGAKNYISDFSQKKWSNNERLRIYMLDDLEQKYKIIGKTSEEIIDLLGNPECISDTPHIKYEYYVGESMIDPLGYQIEFENGVVKDTKVVEH